jgi:hypothetical protein
MNDLQESKLAMYQKVSDTCRKYASAYAGVPAFGQAVAQLEGNIADIVRKAQEQSRYRLQVAFDIKDERGRSVLQKAAYKGIKK